MTRNNEQRIGRREIASYVFVYGSLRRAAGHPTTQLLQPAQFVGEGWATGRLYDLGRYPGMVGSCRPQDRVRGEVYRLLKSKLTLLRLDAYEGCRRGGLLGQEYRRKRLTIRMDNGAELTAWAYLYNGKVSTGGYIPSGDYLWHRRSILSQSAR